MQPYLAVLGNNNYAKLLVLFLEKMYLSPVTVIITEHASSVICTLNRSSCEILNQLVSWRQDVACMKLRELSGCRQQTTTHYQLIERKPFLTSLKWMRSPSSGVIAQDSVCWFRWHTSWNKYREINGGEFIFQNTHLPLCMLPLCMFQLMGEMSQLIPNIFIRRF